MIFNIFPHPGHIHNLSVIMYFYFHINSIVLDIIKDYKLGILPFSFRSYDVTFWESK